MPPFPNVGSGSPGLAEAEFATMARANSAVRVQWKGTFAFSDERVRSMTAFTSTRAEHRAQTRASQVSQDDDIMRALPQSRRHLETLVANVFAAHASSAVGSMGIVARRGIPAGVIASGALSRCSCPRRRSSVTLARTIQDRLVLVGPSGPVVQIHIFLARERM
jgi:hypothetical protein